MCIIFACWSNTFIHFVLTPAISQMVISSRFDAHLKRKVSLWNILSLNGNLSRAVWKEILCDAFSKLNKHPLIIGFLMLFSSVIKFHRYIRLLGISWWRLIGLCLAFASLFFIICKLGAVYHWAQYWLTKFIQGIWCSWIIIWHSFCTVSLRWTCHPKSLDVATYLTVMLILLGVTCLENVFSHLKRH